MADERAVVVESFTKPWKGTIENVRYGELNGSLGLVATEAGLAAGLDLSDEEQANIIASADRLRIQFRGSPEGCLTFDEANLSGIHAPTGDMLDITVRGTRLLRLDADDGLSIWTETGEAILGIRRHGNTTSAGADIHAEARLGLSAQDDVTIMIDTDNVWTSRFFDVRKGQDSVDGAQSLFYVHETVRIGMRLPDIETDTEPVLLPFTDVFLDITYDTEDPLEPGGAIVRGVKDQKITAGSEGGCLQLRGLLEHATDTGKGNTDRALVEVYGAQLSGGALANVAANGNVFSVRAYVSGAWINCIIVDEDGDLYYRGALVAFDEEDDALALSDLYHVLAGEPERVVRYTRSRLHEMGILGSAGDDALLSTHGTTALTLGATRQINERQRALIEAANETQQSIRALDQRIATLEQRGL